VVEQETKTIFKFRTTYVLINAIPPEVIEHADPLMKEIGSSEQQHRYTIRFRTTTSEIFTLSKARGGFFNISGENRRSMALVPVLSNLILTGYPPPPSDTGFNRRYNPIPYSTADQLIQPTQFTQNR
jgi:hypothetical protein